MNIDPRPPACTECGEYLTIFGSAGNWCVLCGKLFCARHLIIRKGVPNCAACERARRIREESGGVSDADEARVVRLILQDLAGIVGHGHESAVQEAAARIRLFSRDAADFEQRPSCPHHPNHPLWYSEQLVERRPAIQRMLKAATRLAR